MNLIYIVPNGDSDSLDFFKEKVQSILIYIVPNGDSESLDFFKEHLIHTIRETLHYLLLL